MNVDAITWDVARTGGLVAYVLLTASVAIGLMLSLGWRSPRWTRFVTNEVHRFVTLLALVFIGVHGLAVAVDPFIKMGLSAVLVPFAGSYRPAWVALGIIAGYILVAVYLSERVRSRVGYAWWRRFHALAFVAFVMALVHGITTGSDTRTIWALALYVGSLAVVGFLLALRLFPDPPKRTRPLGAVLAVAVVAVVAGVTFIGPLQPGWSARAGGAVPAAAAAGSSGPVPSASPTPAGLGIATSRPLPFNGQIGQRGSAVLVQGQTTDGTGAFLVQLTGGSGAIGGKLVLNTGTGQVCQGSVSAVGDTTIDATCSTTDGGAWSLRLAVTQASGSQIQGTLEIARPTGSRDSRA